MKFFASTLAKTRGGLLLGALLFFAPLARPQSAEPSPQCLESNWQKAQTSNLQNHSTWQALLHWQDGWLAPTSEADGPHFLLAGPKATLRSELAATLEAFCHNKAVPTDSPTLPRLPARCQFPAREQFLKIQGLSGWPEPSCPELDDWKNRTGRAKVHLVFSSYYANNPSSVFGHTLLRFDRPEDANGALFNPLLNYGVNFAAVPTTRNPVLYALMGMAGFFQGRFASLPYYYKIREYSDFDARDVWEYELRLSAEQIEMLLNHLWEQGFTHYDYYYFSENCSYHLLTSLQVALPEIDLKSQVPPWVIPVDTVKAVARADGLVRDVKFRPSLYRQFRTRLEGLKMRGLDKEFFAYLEKSEFQSRSLKEDEKAAVLDAVLDYWDFKHARDLLDPQSPAHGPKRLFLKTRAALPVTEPLLFPAQDFERPDESHETARFGLSAGNERSGGRFWDVDLRFSLHDFLDPQRGYPATAKIEFFRFRGRYAEETKAVRVEEAKFFEVALISPIRPLEWNFSWRAVTGLQRSSVGCDNCLAATALGQGGGALGFFGESLIAYALGGGDVRYAPSHRPTELLVLPLATVGLRLLGPHDINVLIEQNYWAAAVYGLSSESTFSMEARKNWNLQTAVSVLYTHTDRKRDDDEKWQLTLYRYF